MNEQQEQDARQTNRLKIIHLVSRYGDENTYCGLKAGYGNHDDDDSHDYVFCPLCEAVRDIRMDGSRSEKWHVTHWLKQLDALAEKKRSNMRGIDCSFTRRVRQIMTTRHLTEKYMARAIGIPVEDFSRKMLGQSDWSIEDAARVSFALNVPVYTLFND